ncbi:Cadherin-24 [Bagarius yarrelli]|uniref:Cadherin-24 n=1 Tax=Bagarius yarrelli TaxID=175774 RepID=A0A556UF84_BAGYA|nr:Cadherin-24 [Bagarius yarrelli]
MPDKRVLLLVCLCLWEGLVRLEPVTKVVRRRGLGQVHSQFHGVSNQWDQPSLEKNGLKLVRIQELISADKVNEKFIDHPKAEETNEALAVSNQKELHDFTAKYSQQESEDSTKMDSRVLKVVNSSTRDLPESRKVKNITINTEILKRVRVNKEISLHRKTDSSLHFNRTRYKSPPSRFKVRPNPVLLNNAVGLKGVLSDSPHKLNLTGNFGVLKLISKDNLVRIVNSQLQNGLTFQNKISHSRKRDLINMDHGQVEEPKIKRQDSASDSYESDNHNKTLRDSVEPQSSTITNPNVSPVHIFRGPVSYLNSNLKDEEEKKTEAESIAVKSKHHFTHVPSTAQSELMASVGASPFTSNTNISVIVHEGTSHAPLQPVSDKSYFFESQTEKTLAKEQSGQNTFASEMELNVTQEPTSKTDDSHILKLQPNPDSKGMDQEDVWEPSVTWPLHGGHGLVFQEMEEDGGEKWNPRERDASRSRSRRSWIWNQFFVIEEYAGPEPVLIGRTVSEPGALELPSWSSGLSGVQDINDNPPVFEDGPYSATVSEMANIGILRTAVPDLDRETQDQYLVVLQAKDMGGHLGGLSGTTTITVQLTDVNDNPPHFTQSSWLFSVSELAASGAEVGRISATDADLGENAKLEYTILEGESGDTFSITGVNQEAIITLTKMDSKVKKKTHGRKAVLKMTVCCDGHKLGTVIVSGSLKLLDVAADELGSDGRGKQAVDYESRSSYSFSVEVMNPTVDPRFLRRGPFKDRASIRVAVLDADEPPRFSRSRYHMEVSENCSPACTVGRISAVDPDTGLSNNIRYSIDPQSDPEALFRITPDTGLITTTTELDREHEQWHNITIIATQRDNPSQASRVMVAIETLDLNDNAPELDRQYTTAMCDSATVGQVVQVLRAIDRDTGGNDSTVYFNIPPESSAALNFSIRESGGPTASLVLLSPLQTLSRYSTSSLTLHVPLVLRDVSSGLTSTATVTVLVCPCLRGGARAGEKEKQSDAEWERETVCLPQHSSLPSPGLSTAALLAILACGATLLAVTALSLSLRRQKRDSLSPLEEDDVRENIITYDDEGGGEADTAAFDITALQSAPHSARRGYRTLDSRNIRLSQRGQDKSQAYNSWAQSGALDSGQYPIQTPLYGRLSYNSQTLPVLRRSHGPYDPGLTELGYRFSSGQPDHSLVIHNQGAMVEPEALYLGPSNVTNTSREGTASQDGTTASEEGMPQKNDIKEDSGSDAQPSQDMNWKHKHILTHFNLPAPPRPRQVQSDSAPRELVLTRSGSLARPGVSGGWLCDSATLPLAGRRSSRAGLSPKESTAGSTDCTDGATNTTQSVSHNYTTILQGEQQKDYTGSLNRGGLEMGSSFVLARPEGGIPLCVPDNTRFVADWQERVGVGAYSLGRRDMMPQLLPYPGQSREAFGGILGYGGAWPSVPEAAGRGAQSGGGQSLALRVGEFLRLRLAQVTFDPTQPPYDSVQVYGLEGTGSRAGSLSSLESEGEKEANKEEWGCGLEEWGPRFHKLAQLFQEREKEVEDERCEPETPKKQNSKEKEEQSRDNRVDKD